MKTKKRKYISCKEAAKYICANLDETNNSQLCREIRKHIRHCPNCTTSLANLKRIVALYQKTSTPKLTPSIEKKLLSALKLQTRNL